MSSNARVPRASRPSLSRNALHDALIASHSATAVLETLLASPVVAHRLPGLPQPATPEQLALLQIATPSELRYRRVQLTACGHVVSSAELWFVPARLPADLLQTLETTNLPFGRVMRPLGLKRRSLAARFGDPDDPAALEHRALLTEADGLPVAEVLECYPRTLFELS